MKGSKEEKSQAAEVEEKKEAEGAEGEKTDIDPGIAEAFVRYRQKHANGSQLAMLMAWIEQRMNQDPTFDVYAIAEKYFNYAPQDIVRLKGWIDKKLAKSFKTDDRTVVRAVAQRVERAAAADYTAEQFEQEVQIVRKVIMKYGPRIKELGYYNEQKQFTDYERFFVDASEFLIANRDTLEERLEELEHYKALSESLQEMMMPRATYANLARLYVWFIANVQALQARGYPIPQFVFEEVEAVVNGTYRQLQAITPTGRRSKR